MWRPDHHNTETLFQCGEINEAKYVTHSAMRALDPRTGERRDIVFASTREPKYCMCNLFKMKPDGANIHQIGRSTLFEGHPAILTDGRILYDRWEYVDRNYGDAQGLWTCNPDGTHHALFWGNNTVSPGGVLSARALSNPSRAIAVLCACHDRPWGALGLIDRSLGIDGKDSVLRTWPASFREEIRTEADVPGSYPVSGGHFVFDNPAFLRTKEVPGNTYVYFQALDADGRMVQSMRSGATREYKFPDRARRLARRVLAHALKRCHDGLSPTRLLTEISCAKSALCGSYSEGRLLPVFLNGRILAFPCARDKAKVRVPESLKV